MLIARGMPFERAIHSWNDANAESRGVVLVPWRWETSSVPMLGDHPQAILNSQGLDRADVVFAYLLGPTGSPTPSAVSGTVEEIEKAVVRGKPVIPPCTCLGRAPSDRCGY